jgi:hypothetical protein
MTPPSRISALATLLEATVLSKDLSAATSVCQEVRVAMVKPDLIQH